MDKKVLYGCYTFSNWPHNLQKWLPHLDLSSFAKDVQFDTSLQEMTA